MFHTVKKYLDSGVFLFLTVNQQKPSRYSNKKTPESEMLASPSVSNKRHPQVAVPKDTHPRGFRICRTGKHEASKCTLLRSGLLGCCCGHLCWVPIPSHKPLHWGSQPFQSFMPLPWVGFLPRQVAQDVCSDHHGCTVNLLFPPFLQFLFQGFPKEDLPTREACVRGKEHSCRRRHLQVRAVFWGQHLFLYCHLL